MEQGNSQSLEFMQEQAIVAIYNYATTRQFDTALKFLSQIEGKNPFDTHCSRLIASNGEYHDEFAPRFGDIWKGENLDGKSIQIYSDQGMGDLINMLSYVQLMKQRWPTCRIVLNCYAYFSEFERLMKCVKCVDEFVKYHTKCDFFTNTFSLPTILSGISLPVHYPAHFDLVMTSGIVPPPVKIDIPDLPICKAIGFSWESNPENKMLYERKSIHIDAIKGCVLFGNMSTYSLVPNKCPNYAYSLDIKDLYDTAYAIKFMKCVVSVDTVVLHLAGALGVKTFGLIPEIADPRWGNLETTVWYPSVTLYRQSGSWSDAISKIRSGIEALS